MFKSRKRKKRINWLLVVFSSLLFWVSLSLPAYSFVSSVDSCAAQASCASGFVGTTGVRGAVTQAVAPQAANQSINYSLFKSSVSQTIAGTILGLGVGAAIVSNSSGGEPSDLSTISLNSYQTSDIEAFQDTAKTRYCTQNPDAYVCRPRDVVATYAGTHTAGNFSNFAISSSSESQICVVNSAHSLGVTCNPVYKSYDQFEEEKIIDQSITLSDGSPGVLGTYRVFGVINTPLDWSQWDGQSRIDAVALLNDDELVLGISNSPLTIPDAIDAGDTLTFDTSSVEEDSNLNFELSPTTVINFGVGGQTGGQTGGSTTTGNQTGGSTTGGSTTTGNQTGTNTGSQTGTTGTPPPEEENLVAPQVSPIAPSQFSSPNFLQHAVTVFSDKFPFDIFDSVSGSSSVPQCPNYTFFNKTYELCPISDLFGVLKVPVIIAFLIRSIQTI